LGSAGRPAELRRDAAGAGREVPLMSMFLGVVLENGAAAPESVDTKSFAWHCDDLDLMARALGLRPLGEFEVDYGERRDEILDEMLRDEDTDDEDIYEAMSQVGDDGPWFDPDEGLRTVHGLIQHIENLPAGEANEVKLLVLRGLVSELSWAKQNRLRFHFAFEG
jgi:hypothetical protein